MIFFFFNDTATTEIYTLSLHDALPILAQYHLGHAPLVARIRDLTSHLPALALCGNAYEGAGLPDCVRGGESARSEEHTSELQSRQYLVCRLLLEKKKTNK